MMTPQMKSNKKKKPAILQQSQKGGLENIAVKYSDIKLYNKVEDNFHLNNKKALFMNMKNYYEAMD
jgi:hypothetical protein